MVYKDSGQITQKTNDKRLAQHIGKITSNLPVQRLFKFLDLLLCHLSP